MKYLILGLCLNIFLYAEYAPKEDSPKKHIKKESVKQHKVTILYDKSSKKGLGKIALVVGGFVFNVLARVVADTDSVHQLAEDIESYIQEFGLSPEKIAQRFSGQIELAIIDQCKTKEDHYKTSDKIQFDIRLKQKAYTYLFTQTSKHLCLIYPNNSNIHTLYLADRTYTIPSTDYQIYGDTKGHEKFYFLMSLQPISLENFTSQGNYRCIPNQTSIDKLSQWNANKLKELKEITIEIF